MLTKDVIRYFSPSPDDQRGAKTAITQKLEISSGYVSQWGDLVPETQAMRLHLLTSGKSSNGVVLTYDPAAYTKTSTA